MKLVSSLFLTLAIFLVGEVLKTSAIDQIYDQSVQYTNAEIKGQKFLLEVSLTENFIYPSPSHPDIFVVNLGKIPVQVSWAYGTKSGWIGTYNDEYLEPGEHTSIKSDSAFFYTGLKCYIAGSVRGIIYGKRYYGKTGKTYNKAFNLPKIDYWRLAFNYLNTAIFVAASQYGSIANAVVAREAMESIFFPTQTTDPWDQIKDRLEKRIRQSEKAVIRAILDNELKPFDIKIKNVLEEAKDDNEEGDFREIYMHLAQDFIGIEEKFHFTDTEIKSGDVNYYILPMYSRFINMKLMYYTWGVTYGGALKLTKKDVKKIIRYRNNTVAAARKHIVKLYQTQADATYDECDPNNLFNAMMEVRSYIAEHGLRFIQTWNRVADINKYKKKDYSVLTYSEFFGRQTPNLDLQAVVKFGTLPLTPMFMESDSGMYRRSLDTIIVHLDGDDKKLLVGLELQFQGGGRSMLGSTGSEEAEVDLWKAHITKFKVRGRDMVDWIYIELDVEDIFHFGRYYEGSTVVEHDFSKPDHYIASIFTANDQEGGTNQLSNIAVSYLPLISRSEKYKIENGIF